MYRFAVSSTHFPSWTAPSGHKASQMSLQCETPTTQVQRDMGCASGRKLFRVSWRSLDSSADQETGHAACASLSSTILRPGQTVPASDKDKQWGQYFPGGPSQTVAAREHNRYDHFVGV